MNDKQFISNLSSTYADVRRLDAKKINLKGKNILEYIDENKTVILDERGTNADDELDIWNSYVTKDENGNVIIKRNAKPFEHSYNTISSTQTTNIKSAVKVIDNEVLGSDDTHIMYWQTDGLTNGDNMFSNCSNLASFNSHLSNLTNGDYMFYYCENLTTFTSDLSSLTNGCGMFNSCSALTSFSSDLSSLTNGEYMFSWCSNLTTFSSDLSSLTNGYQMFYYCENLTSFSSDLSSLTNGYGMFDSCTNLASFTSNLSSLTSGEYMFFACTNLTSFNSDLSSLTNGNNMFHNCKLDTQSVANIIHFIPQRDAKPTDTWSEGNILIGIGIPNTDEAKQTFAEECYCDSWEELNQDFSAKNWHVEWQFNGPASYSLRDPRPSTAVYAKLEEVIMPTDENEHKPHYKYTSVDGSKLYNIHWYHESNMEDESYTLFDSLEAAIESYNVVLKANN